MSMLWKVCTSFFTISLLHEIMSETNSPSSQAFSIIASSIHQINIISHWSQDYWECWFLPLPRSFPYQFGFRWSSNWTKLAESTNSLGQNFEGVDIRWSISQVYGTFLPGYRSGCIIVWFRIIGHYTTSSTSSWQLSQSVRSTHGPSTHSSTPWRNMAPSCIRGNTWKVWTIPNLNLYRSSQGTNPSHIRATSLWGLCTLFVTTFDV